MAISINMSNSELTRALTKFKSFPVEKKRALAKEVAKTAFDIDKRQKLRLKLHSSREGKNYSAMMASNHVKVNLNIGRAEVSNAHKAAVFFEEGTKRHKIRAKNKKVLATLNEYSYSGAGTVNTDKSGNEWRVFGTEVDHPGTKPKPFFYLPVLNESKKYAERMKKILEIK